MRTWFWERLPQLLILIIDASSFKMAETLISPTDYSNTHSAAPLDAARTLPFALELGATLASAPSELASADWLHRPLSGQPDLALAWQWASGCHR